MADVELTCVSSLNKNNQSTEICGVCKGKTVLKRVKCDKCNTYYHNSCVAKLKNIDIIDGKTIQCCDRPESDLGEEDGDSFEDSFVSLTDGFSHENLDSARLEIKFLKSIIKAKNTVIQLLREKLTLHEIIQQIQQNNNVSPSMKMQNNDNTSEMSQSPVADKRKEARKSINKSAPTASGNEKISAKTVNKRNKKITTTPAVTREQSRNSEDSAPNKSRSKLRPHEITRVSNNATSSLSTETSASSKSSSNSTLRDEGAWKTAPVKKRRNNSMQVGTAVNSAVEIAPKKAFIYATRFGPKTTPEQVKALISNKFPEVMCEAIQSNFPKFYTSFKLTVNLDDFDKAIDTANWPRGIYISRFFHRRAPTPSQT